MKLDPDTRRRLELLQKEAQRRLLRNSFVGEGGLYRFIKHFWHVLEPNTKFKDGWAMRTVCDHLQAVTDGHITRILINVPPGFCKALDHDTPILTTWGWKKHGGLVVGDFVFGPDGTPKRVLACTADRVVESFAVKFDDGAEIVASGDHLWEIERDVPSVKPKYRRGRKSMVVPTSDLRISGYKHQSSYEKRPDRIKVSEAIKFPPRQLMIDPYVLGAWLGDGGSNEGIIYAGEQDAEHFCKLGRVSHVAPPVPPRKSAFYHITIEGLRVRLRLMGLIQNKHIPQEYLESSIEQRWELLRGLMDTDGMCAKNGSCSFVNKNKAIADGFMVLARSLGLKAWKTETWSQCEGKTFGPYQFINFIPPVGAIVFNLPRKQARVRGNMNDRSRNRYVDSVESVGLRRVKCIQVEGNLYLAGRELVTTHNSLITDVFWPAWEWGPMKMPHLRYVTFSYSVDLTERDNDRFGVLVTNPEYQETFNVGIRSLGKKLVSNTSTGWKLASSVGGVGTGQRGDRIVLDDPHNVKDSESDTVRTETIRWFRESMSNRLNDMEHGVIVVIMQRVHGEDVSGVILEKGMAYDHLMIPMFYDYGRQTDNEYEPVRTSIGWYDPRYDECDPNDESQKLLAWPERFSEDVCGKLQTDIGIWAWASQYQQSPAPRGGGIFQRDWWQLWESPDGRFPVFDYLVASLDSAFTEQERNDPSALTIWGVFSKEGESRIMLVHAWRKHLQFSGPRMDMAPGESKQHWVQRTQPTWGLMEWTKYTCERFRVDKLLIEAKASGISAAQELSNRYGRLDFAVQLCQVAGSKEARAYAAQPTFSQLLVYAPARDWAEMVIDEMESFPKHKYRDLTDSATQAVKHLRSLGLANTDEESKAIEVEEQIRDLAKLKRGSVAGGYFS